MTLIMALVLLLMRFTVAICCIKYDLLKEIYHLGAFMTQLLLRNICSDGGIDRRGPSTSIALSSLNCLFVVRPEPFFFVVTSETFFCKFSSSICMNLLIKLTKKHSSNLPRMYALGASMDNSWITASASNAQESGVCTSQTFSRCFNPLSRHSLLCTSVKSVFQSKNLVKLILFTSGRKRLRLKNTIQAMIGRV